MNHQSFANRSNLDLIEEYYQLWRAEPRSVDERWQAFFEGFELGGSDDRESTAQTRVVRLIQAHRDVGHLIAHLDPLSDPPVGHDQLEIQNFGLSAADLDKAFDGSAFLGLHRTSLRDIISVCRETYCRTIGFEFYHIQDLKIRQWFKERLEPNRGRPSYDKQTKIRILHLLFYAEIFEDFLQSSYQGQKRFSLEGSETLIPLLETLVQKSPMHGIQEYVIGMAHRGRMNVLTNILGMPYDRIFAEFEEHFEDYIDDGDGDVKYHLGFSNTLNVGGHALHVCLTTNPSHLEAVNPVVIGRVRAKQSTFNDIERRRGVPILIHGDAAVAGQGPVTETLNMANLEGYTVGGCFHIVTNNQIGFTTVPAESRSTRYCTEVAKLTQAPILHVNSADPEAVVFCAELALEFRQTFRQDVWIDLIGYRKYGHNEGDEPTYTQPQMYQKIRSMPPLSRIYGSKLVQEGVISPEENQQIQDEFKAKLVAVQKDLRNSPRIRRGIHSYGNQLWKNFSFKYSHDPVATAVPYETLHEVSEGLTRLPENFTMHPKLRSSVIERWQEVVRTKGSAEWGLGETLAFGSLLLDGTPIRLSGQDSRRGTFSHRHAGYVDAKTGQRYVPLDHLRSDQARFQVWNSPLSEFAVMGFEFGYSIDDPTTLVIWEAQFGDFANGAQIIIDQFLAASESKWQRASGLVLLLPHGLEGQGPEHSSARLERFLQMCGDDNWQIVDCTTPAQYFHLLRRQVKRNFRKPLVVMTPKSILRHPLARSPMADFSTGTFHEVLDDAKADPNLTRRVFLCSGKIYYDFLWDSKEKKQRTLPSDVALIRMEQMYPFPEQQLKAVLARYPKAHKWVWVQEEPQNMGAWSFMETRLRDLKYPVEYVGRDGSASPATGSYRIHEREQREIVEAALNDWVPYLVRAVPPTTEKGKSLTAVKPKN